MLKLKLTNIKETKETSKMLICVVVCWLTGFFWRQKTILSAGKKYLSIVTEPEPIVEIIKKKKSTTVKTNHILWFIWPPIRPRSSTATSRDQRLNQQPVRGIWGCWQRARAHREGPIIKPDLLIIQPTPQRLHWQTWHTQIHRTRLHMIYI